MDITLTFINRSDDGANTNVVMFQKNTRASDDAVAVAWRVAPQSTAGDTHAFALPYNVTVAVRDSHGNDTAQVSALPGHMFTVGAPTSDATLSHSVAETGGDAREVQVRNDLSHGAINASVYKDGRLLAIAPALAPGQNAAFAFRPTLWIGALANVSEGDLINPAMASSVNTELALDGIASADIIMSGGGQGDTAAPIVFTLENIKLMS